MASRQKYTMLKCNGTENDTPQEQQNRVKQKAMRQDDASFPAQNCLTTHLNTHESNPERQTVVSRCCCLCVQWTVLPVVAAVPSNGGQSTCCVLTGAWTDCSRLVVQVFCLFTPVPFWPASKQTDRRTDRQANRNIGIELNAIGIDISLSFIPNRQFALYCLRILYSNTVPSQ